MTLPAAILGYTGLLLLLILMSARQTQVLRMGFGVALAPHAVLATLAIAGHSEGQELGLGQALRGACVLWTAPILLITGVGSFMLIWVRWRRGDA